MIKEFNNLEEIQKYYDEKTNTYVFKENDKYIGLIKINFALKTKSNIDACNINASNIEVYNIDACDINVSNIKAGNINAWSINALDINACDIKAECISSCDIDAWDINAENIIARDINAWDINSFSIVADNITYFAVCFAYDYIKCKSIKGRRENAKHFVLDGKIEIEDC